MSAVGLSSEATAEEEVVELSPRVVTASPFVQEIEELAVPADTLTGEALSRNLDATLGDTLDGRPGVHSTYFGPGAGRPVIRGFDGDRVRILNDGTDSFDISQTSPDHGVGIEPLFAEAIEVVRGPATLLYGNAAIGGVVNVLGKEIPNEPSSKSLSGEVEVAYGTASDEKRAGVVLEGGRKNLSWSFGYMDRESGDMEIPGYAESKYLLEEEGEEPDADGYGVLENSFVDTRSGFLGMTWFGDVGSLGGSYSKYDTTYGVPGHSHSHEHEEEEDVDEDHDDHEEHEEEQVSVDLDLSRFSLKGEFGEQWKFWEKIEVLFSYGDYRHRELEGDEVGTTFERDGYELRITGVHEPIGAFSGVVGLNVKDDSFAAFGEEAFVPSNDTSQYGLFLLERLDRDWGAWEFGGRVESIEINPIDAEIGNRKFTTANGSVGMVRKFNERNSAALNLTYAERAPNSSELYAFGPHIATRNFEIGNADLDKERAVSLDASYRILAGPVTGGVTFFYSDFSDYVYLEYLSSEDVESEYGDLDTHELDVYRSVASDASFYGFEVDLRYHIIDEGDRRLHIDLMADQTRATNDSFDENLPRIPTRRVGTRVGYEVGSWNFGLEGRYHFEATHLAPQELPTDDFLLIGLDVRYRIQTMDTFETDIFLVGSNLGDEEARTHTSFLKDMVPMPGRSWKLGLKTRF